MIKKGSVPLTRSQRDKANLIITSNINKLKGIPSRQIDELKTLKQKYKETDNKDRAEDILTAIIKITNELPTTARGISFTNKSRKQRKTRKQRRKEYSREKRENKIITRANRQHRRRNHSRK